ncbi:NADH dehydrogenase [Boeremia exigua]|uniref:NADH dehydrogenase n=1 Tax=Boeremia exigua TaxID=749465 RepID=UPI001E8E3457|nr:NADH dehydrogenase [Boeremia exigua]KAH6612991.1 NADH dehydrogenase [Boeremia exigua]
MKPATACLQCRSSKRKCLRNLADPQAACLACQGRKDRCSKPWIKPRSNLPVPWTVPKLQPAPSEQGPFVNYNDEAPLATETSGFIRLYFRYIHDRPHSLFHEQSLWKAVNNGALPESLSTAICALGCRFAATASQRDLVSTFMTRSKCLLAQQLEDISVANIQTCILLANSYAAEQNNRLEALYFGIANRMAYVLGLHQRDRNDTSIVRETKSRVWWSLFMADRWCPPSLGLPRELIRSNPTVDLPIDEVVFQSLRLSNDVALTQRSTGIWTYKTTLADILTSIQDVNLTLVRDSVASSVIDQQVEEIADRLLTWQRSLPQHMVMSDENLEKHRENGQGGTFVALHLGYHHYSTLLYFQYLEPDREPTDQTIAYASRCSFHGLAISRLLHNARQFDDCHVVYLTVAHMLIVSSSVLLHILLLGDDVEVETARMQLTLNFQALEDLTRYWPCVEHMKKRLFVFQDACLRSSAAKTYAVDRWIVRFLLEYGLPLEEKSDDVSAKEAPLTKQHENAVSLERRAFLGEALESVRG